MGRVCRECIRLIADAFAELSSAETYSELGKPDKEALYLGHTGALVSQLQKLGCISSEAYESIKRFLDMRDYDCIWGSLASSVYFVASKCQKER